MTRPRKEQVNDPRTYLTPLAYGGLILGGATSQTFSGGSLTSLLGSTITGATGGAEVTSAAVLFGGTGPFTVSVADSFSVRIPGANAGVAMPVVIQAGDMVTLGGSSVLTTSRAAARINAAVAALGVSYPVASNVGGRLRLVSAVGAALSTGDAASVTIADVTPGVCAALGFGVGTTFTSSGTTAPKRGLVTKTSDGLGSTVALRNKDGSDAVSVPTYSSAVLPFGRKNVPSVPPGDPVAARMTADSTSVRLGFVRKGYLSPRVISSISNFSTLTIAESVTLTVAIPEIYSPALSVPVTFNPAPTTVQDVVDRINTAYNAAFQTNKAAVGSETLEPYDFSESPLGPLSNLLAFKLNGNATVTADLSGLTTANAVITAINAAIVAAGQVLQGLAAVDSGNGVGFYIQSLNVSGPGSSVEIMASPASTQTVLQTLGIVPGLYKGFLLATKYGNDEIMLAGPAVTPLTTLTVAGTAPVLAKLGLSAVTVGPAVGEDPYILPTSDAFSSSGIVKAALPEIMEFGEVPSNQSSIEEAFGAPRSPNAPVVSAGVANAGRPAFLGDGGTLDASFIPSVLQFLALNTLQLGANDLVGPIAAVRPRMLVPRNAASGQSYVLMAEFPDMGGTTDVFRLYSYSASLLFVRNARLNPAGSWVQDNTGRPSTIFRMEGNKTVIKYQRAGTAPWIDGDWGAVADDPNVSIDVSTGDMTFHSGYGTAGAVRFRGDNAAVFDSIESTGSINAVGGDLACANATFLQQLSVDKSFVAPYTLLADSDVAIDVDTYEARVPQVTGTRIYTLPTPWIAGQRIKISRLRTADAFTVTLRTAGGIVLGTISSSASGWIEGYAKTTGAESWVTSSFGGTVTSLLTTV